MDIITAEEARSMSAEFPPMFLEEVLPIVFKHIKENLRTRRVTYYEDLINETFWATIDTTIFVDYMKSLGYSVRRGENTSSFVYRETSKNKIVKISW